MHTQQAYIEGFIKRAAEHGFSAREAMYILKSAESEPAPIYDAAAEMQKARLSSFPDRYIYGKAMERPSLVDDLAGKTPYDYIRAVRNYPSNLTKAQKAHVGEKISPLMRETQMPVRSMDPHMNPVYPPTKEDIYQFKPNSLREALTGGAYGALQDAQKPRWINPSYIGTANHRRDVGEKISPLMRKTQPTVRDLPNHANLPDMSLAGTPLNLPSQTVQGGASAVSPQGIPNQVPPVSAPQNTLLEKTKALARSKNTPLNIPVVK